MRRRLAKLATVISVAAIAFVGAPAPTLAAADSSSTTVLTFEGLANREQILEFYNGGTGSLGSTGPNYGVSFGADTLGLISHAGGGTGNLTNEPSPHTVAFFLSGPGVVMNVPAGFTTGFSFFYTSSQPASVSVYDGPDATGNLLGTLSLNANYQDEECGFGYCHWDAIGVTFAGTARSVNFAGAADRVAFDDITLGSEVPGPTSPECDGEVGVETAFTLVDGPDPVDAGAHGTWLLELGLIACEDLAEVTAQGGTVAWADTTHHTDHGTLAVRHANRRNTVLLWELGSMTAGETATATFEVTGTTDRKAACDSLVDLIGDWSASATTAQDPDAAPVKYDEAPAVTVTVDGDTCR